MSSDPFVPISSFRLETALRFGDLNQPQLAGELGYSKQAISLLLKGQRKGTRASVRMAITALTLGEPIETNAEWLGGSPTAIRVKVPEFQPLALDTQMVISGGWSEQEPAQMLLIEGEYIGLDRTNDDLDLDRLQLLRELLPIIPRVPQTRNQRDSDMDDSLRVTIPISAIWGLSTASSWWKALLPHRFVERKEDYCDVHQQDAFRYGKSVLESLRLIFKPWVSTSTPIPLEFLEQIRRQWNALSPNEDDRLFRPETRKKK